MTTTTHKRAVAKSGLRAFIAGFLLFASLGFVSKASADTVFAATHGPEAGQTANPQGIAVDDSSGTVYVADKGNNRVDVFDAAGNFVRAFGWGVADGTSAELQTCTATCFQGIAGAGSGQFNGLNDIAVDNDPTSSSYHDVYVVDAENNRVQKFAPSGAFIFMLGGGVDRSNEKDICTAASAHLCGPGAQGSGAGAFDTHVNLALGTAGTLYVGDSESEAGNNYSNRVQEFSPDGEPTDEFTLSGGTAGPIEGGIAVDSTGAVYVSTSNLTGAVRKYDAAGTLTSTVNPSLNIHAIAVDATGNLFVGDSTNDNGGAETAVYEYDPSGAPNATFYGDGTLRTRAISLAPYSDAAGDIFALETSSFGGLGRIVHVSFPPPGPVIPDDAGLLKASPLGNVRATLNASVNPEGKSSTVHFQYVDDADYQNGGFSNPATETTPESASLGSDFRLHAASVQIACSTPGEPGCLEPETTYHFRAVATNGDGTSVGPEATFQTLPPAQFDETFATEVGVEAATIHAVVNPLSLPTTAHFQYVDDAAFRTTGFAAARQAPAGAGLIHFGSGEAEVTRSASLASLAPGTTYHYRVVVTNFFGTFDGPERTFNTFSAAVAPGTTCANEVFRTDFSANLPDCRAYEMVSPVDKNNRDIFTRLDLLNVPLWFYESSSDGEGLTYSSSTAFGDATSAPFVNQYLARRDPQTGWTTHSISPPFETNIEPGIPNTGSFNENQFFAFSNDLSTSWLFTDSDPPLAAGAIRGYTNIYRRDNETGSYEALTKVQPPSSPPYGEGQYTPSLQGLSSDGTHMVIQANDKLTSNAANSVVPQLYEVIGAGKPRLVSVLPNGATNTLGSEVGYGVGANHRFNRNAHGVSEDGSRVFWTAFPWNPSHGGGPGKIYVRINGKTTVPVSESVSEAPATYWTAAVDGSKAIFSVGQLSSGEGDLYSFDVDTETPTLIAHHISGVVGASSDARRVYFVSSELLAPGASAGTCAGEDFVVSGCNLYLYEEGVGISYVTTLPDNEAQGERTGYAVDSVTPYKQEARVSPDGSRLVFGSRASLTGYDNHDAVSGKSDREVYLFDADSGELHCVSCNPSGARPLGRALTNKYGDDEAPTAAQIGTWEWSSYAQRYLSDNGGRLFFESFDALVPSDTNGREDVYEWEAAGTGECAAQSADYFVSAGGCLSLISSGTGAGDSEFVDASPGGDDVFFTTGSSLVPQDPGLVDIYDARVGGGFPPPPGLPAACEGEACQGPLTPPNDPTPASAAFEGPGNVAKKKQAKKKQAKKKQAKKKQAKKKKKQKKKHRQTAKKHGKSSKGRHQKASHHRAAGNNRGAAR